MKLEQLFEDTLFEFNLKPLFEQVLIEASLSNLLLLSMPLMEPVRTADTLRRFLKGPLLSDNTPIQLNKNQWIHLLDEYKNTAGVSDSKEKGFIPAINNNKITPEQFDNWIKELENNLKNDRKILNDRELSDNEIAVIIDYFKGLTKKLN